MKLNLIFLSVVLVMQYEWLGVNCGCENIDSLEAFKAKTQGGKAAVLVIKCVAEQNDEMQRDNTKEMEIKRVSHTLEPKTYEHIDSLCAYKV
ncbi:uncharacterized protein LOC111056440 isoform X3 [Nilaparvata lugens]|uniref:uncharacterized protein LOC111056440 isoform X3 n=1 Tax=Nilaparvata lugens TaxID=108931 RepID=UPI00193E42C9|nr:uncharacterized protein LOC111056440 isoform X3 [Nilaparvata lugens]